MNRQPAVSAILTLVVVIVGVGLAVANGDHGTEFFKNLANTAIGISLRLLYSTGLILLVTGACFGRSRNSRVLAAGVIAGALSVLTACYRVFVGDAPLDDSAVSICVRIAESLSRPSFVVPVLLLLSNRFEGKLDRLRLATICLIGAFAAIDVIIVINNIFRYSLIVYNVIHPLEAIVIVLTVAAICGCAWCLAFRCRPQPSAP